MRASSARTALALLSAGALLAPCRAEAPGEAGAADARPSILLVTLDTLRADRLAQGGPMPRLWELAARGVLFQNAHAQVPLTLPSHTSILTGRGVESHGVQDNLGYVLRQEVPTVAALLAEAGYATAAFVGGYPLVRSFGLARGFEVYDDRMTRTPPGARSGHTERRAAEVVDAALDWLRGARAPSFAWVHLYDAHDPYEAPASFARGDLSPYDAEVAYVDHELGRLLAGTRTAVPGRPWTIVTADHGEALGEHGEATHGVFLYEATLHVPLVVVPPDGAAAVSRTPVSLLDVAPTLLEIAGLPRPAAWLGVSLLRSSPAKSRSPLYLESHHGAHKYGWAPLAGYLDWPMKFIEAPRAELYDVELDPGERTNLAAAADVATLEAWLARARTSNASAARADTPPAAAERLAALGYVDLSGPEPARGEARPDPKDRVAALAPLERGLRALEGGRVKEAAEALELALAQDPGNLVALNNLGILALQGGNLERAAGLFEQGMAAGGSAELANNLGLARSRQGRHAEAAAAFRRALALRPAFTAARFNLALALHRQGASNEALEELARVRAAEPDFPGLAEATREIESAPREARGGSS